MSDHWTELPMMLCPHCKEESQIDDYYDIKVGSTINCPKCEAEVEVLDTDTVLLVLLKGQNDA